MKYIVYREKDNKVMYILTDKPISISNDLAIAQAETIPDKYDWLTVANVHEQTDTWTEKVQVEKVNEKGEPIFEEVEVKKSKTYMVCDLVANFRPPLTAEQIAIQKQKRYENLASSLIRQKYSQNAVEALLANYAEDKEKYQAEFDAFAAYRKECKAKAKTMVYDN